MRFQGVPRKQALATQLKRRLSVSYNRRRLSGLIREDAAGSSNHVRDRKGKQRQHDLERIQPEQSV